MRLRNPRQLLAAVSQKQAPNAAQGRVMTLVRCDGVFSDDFVVDLLLQMKNFFYLVSIWQSCTERVE